MSAPYRIGNYPPPDDGFAKDDIPLDADVTPLNELRFLGGKLQQRFLVESKKVTFFIWMPPPDVRA